MYLGTWYSLFVFCGPTILYPGTFAKYWVAIQPFPIHMSIVRIVCSKNNVTRYTCTRVTRVPVLQYNIAIRQPRRKCRQRQQLQEQQTPSRQYYDRKGPHSRSISEAETSKKNKNIQKHNQEHLFNISLRPRRVKATTLLYVR